ncbi:MAG: 6-phosphogluconolactonase, partial [Candidatus Zixiibacteriota bacterium]
MNSPPEQSASLPFDSFADTGSLPLNPALINESLNELWERSQSETHGDAAYTRVTLADLVIVTDRVSQPRAEKLSMQFARERPSRSIMLLVEDTPEETDIRAEIGIACSMTSEGSDMLCWEKINVRLPRAKLEAAPNIIRSLTSGVNLLVIVDLLPCLIGESVNTALYELADYVFFDSRINRRKLAAKIQAGRGSLDRLFDLEYERDHPLREAIKLAFDDERLCESLSELEKVIIRPGSSMVRAMYICGWLSAKLKLSYARHESRRSLVFNAAGEQQVDVEVRAAGKQGSGSRRNAVQFYFGLDRKDCLEIRHARPGQNGDHAGASDRYEILWNGAPRAVSPHGGLDESEYMLRRTSDTYRRGDYTESLRRTLTLLFAGSRDPSGEAVVSVLRSGNPAMVTQKAADLFVEIMRESVIRNGRFTVALAGGGTPVNVYRRLSESVYATCTEWAETLFFFGDERAVPPTHEDSNYLMARLNLFERLSVNPDKVFRMGGELDDLGAAAREYQ